MNRVAFQLGRLIGWTLACVCWLFHGLLVTVKFLFVITPAGWLFLPVVIMSGIERERVRRRMLGLTALGYFRQAVACGKPLHQVVRAAADSEQGRLSKSLRQTADALDEGVPLDRAVDPRLVDDRQRALLHSALVHGTLRPTLDRLCDQELDAIEEVNIPHRDMQTHPFMTLLLIPAALVFIMLIIVPKFVEIFNDFGTRLPWVTLKTIELSRWLAGPLLPKNQADPSVVVPGIVLITTLLTPVWTLLILIKLGWPGWLVLKMRWWLWPWRGVARALAYADVLRTLGDALQVGASPSSALASTRAAQAGHPLSGRLLRWREGIDAGLTLDESAEQAGLPALLVTTLRSGQLSNRPAQAASFLADLYDTRAAREGVWWQAIRPPMITLINGACVAFLVLAMFLPLIQLIRSLT